MWILSKLCRKNNNKKQEISNLSQQIHHTANQTKYLSDEVKNLSSAIKNSTDNQNKPKFLGNIGSLISLLSTFGLLLGGFITYFYLNGIDQLSLFTDVMSNVSSLMAILVVVTLLWIVFSIGFFEPWGFIFQSDIQQSNLKSRYIQKKFCKIPFSFLAFSISIICSFIFIVSIQFKGDLIQYKFLLTLITFIIFSPCIIIFFQYRCSLKKEINLLTFSDGIYYLFNILAFSFIVNIIPLFIFIFSTAWINKENLQYYFIYGTLIALYLNLFICCLFAAENAERKHFFLIFPSVIAFFTILIYAALSNNFSFHVLHTIRFVESPANASWYLLHNDFQQFDDKQEVHGINHRDLAKIREHFKHPSIQKNQCSAFDQIQSRKNALYGYMAWNLGNTKVFCPENVRNYTPNKNIEGNKFGKEYISKKCLVIDGKSLQILSAYYIRGEKQ
ncbi:hypothetical protein [Neisseria sp. CCUG12390]|uniref:hypothetical protein n=1 Tax=Neisseria sp. CCUG12390 TaxID=3392035 RepID=UPI003A0FD711